MIKIPIMRVKVNLLWYIWTAYQYRIGNFYL